MFGRKKCDDQNKFNICTSAGSECDVMATKDTCEGSTLVYCDDGYVERTDCTTLGFAGCGPLKLGATVLGAQCI